MNAAETSVQILCPVLPGEDGPSVTIMQILQAAVPALLMLAQEVEAKTSREICNKFIHTPHNMRHLSLTALASESSKLKYQLCQLQMPSWEALKRSKALCLNNYSHKIARGVLIPLQLHCFQSAQGNKTLYRVLLPCIYAGFAARHECPSMDVWGRKTCCRPS